MLGPFEVWYDGVQLDLGDLQQRYILIVLLLHANKPVPTERLIEIVWGERRGMPRTNLIPGYVAKLRKAFREGGVEDASIETTPTGYILRVDVERQLDTVRFMGLCDDAAAGRRSGDPARAAQLLHEAVDLWRGRFLEDVDIDRIAGGGEVISWGEVISLDEALIDALGDLAELELAAGNHRWVRDRLRPAVHADPSRQRLTILLMRALLANGDRVQAIDVYHKTRDALDEYGMETSTDLRGLARLAQYGEPRSTLPPRPIRFTGRAEELSRIEAFARSVAAADQPGVIWLSGMPGVGKTALAIQAAHALRTRFADGQVFVALNGFTPSVEPTTPSEAVAGLLLDLGVPAEQIPRTASGRFALYRDKLAGTQTLMVLDNAAAEDQVRALLPTASGCLAIVTSRAAGALEADNLRLGPLSADEAADLFRNLVDDQRLKGRSRQVSEVVARCGRVPLQIRIVASQFRRHAQWPLDYLIELLSQTGPWNSGAGFDDAGVVACMVSYQQLDDSQRTLFRLLGLVPGQALSVRGVAALMDCGLTRARALLNDLHRVSLVEEMAPERYQMLDPLKDFASSVLEPDTPHQQAEAMDRLLDFYLVTATAATATIFPGDQQPIVDRHSPAVPTFPDQEAALSWLSAERTNLVAAIRYAAIHHRPGHTWLLAVLLWRYFYTTGNLRDWMETLELAKQAVMADPSNPAGQAHVLLRLSGAHWRSGNLDQALEPAAQALSRYVQLGDVRGEADALCAIALPTLERGDHDQAFAHFEAALAKYQEIDDNRGQANAVSILGHINELHGNLEPAEQQQMTAVRLLREIGHTQGLAHALDNLGSVRQRLGRLEEAIADHEEALALAVDLGDRSLEAYALSNIGNVHRLRGRLDEAMRHHEQAGIAIKDVGDPHVRTQLHLDRGATYQARGDQRAALRAYRSALDLTSGTGDRSQRAYASRGMAQSLHATGDHEQAAEFWRAARAEFGDLRQPEAEGIDRERAQLTCACAITTGVRA